MNYTIQFSNIEGILKVGNTLTGQISNTSGEVVEVNKYVARIEGLDDQQFLNGEIATATNFSGTIAHSWKTRIPTHLLIDLSVDEQEKICSLPYEKEVAMLHPDQYAQAPDRGREMTASRALTRSLWLPGLSNENLIRKHNEVLIDYDEKRLEYRLKTGLKKVETITPSPTLPPSGFSPILYDYGVGKEDWYLVDGFENEAYATHENDHMLLGNGGNAYYRLDITFFGEDYEVTYHGASPVAWV